MPLFHSSVLVHRGREPVHPVAGHWNIFILLIKTPADVEISGVKKVRRKG